MLNFIKKVYQNRKKDYYLLLILITILASFEFCSLAIYDSVNNYQLNIMSSLTLNAIPALSTFIALTLSVFILKYFIENKKQEFSILLISGRNSKDLFQYIIYQFGTLSLLAFILGIGIGSLLMFMMNIILSQLSIINIFQYSIINTLFIYFCFFVFTIVFILAICSQQFVALEKNLVYYLAHKTEPKNKVNQLAFHIIPDETDKKKSPVFSILSLILAICITVFCCIHLLEPNLTNNIFYYMFALLCVIFIMNKGLSIIYDLFHHYLIKHPVIIQGIANFNNFADINETLINLNVILISSMLFIVIINEKLLLVQIVVFPCFIMTLIMMSLCFILRYSYFDEKIRVQIATYYAIGYNQKKLQSILTFINFLFGILGVIIPMILFIILSLRAYYEGFFSLETFIGLLIVYVFTYFFILIYMFIKEKKMLKEVTNHVKYLNRSI